MRRSNIPESVKYGFLISSHEIPIGKSGFPDCVDEDKLLNVSDNKFPCQPDATVECVKYDNPHLSPGHANSTRHSIKAEVDIQLGIRGKERNTPTTFWLVLKGDCLDVIESFMISSIFFEGNFSAFLQLTYLVLWEGDMIGESCTFYQFAVGSIVRIFWKRPSIWEVSFCVLPSSRRFNAKYCNAPKEGTINYFAAQ